MAQLPRPGPQLFGRGTSEDLGACFAESTQALPGDLCIRHSSNKEVVGQRESSPACPLPALGLAGWWVCGLRMSIAIAGPWVSHQWEGIHPNKGKEEGVRWRESQQDHPPHMGAIPSCDLPCPSPSIALFQQLQKRQAQTRREFFPKCLCAPAMALMALPGFAPGAERPPSQHRRI